MATTKTKNQDTSKPNPSPPSGFDIQIAEAETDGWWRIEEGSVVTGRLLGLYPMRSSGREYYQVKLSQPCKANVGKGSDAEVKTLKAGQVIGFDERSGMKGLRKYAESDGVFDIWILAKEKKDIGGGQTWWQFDIRGKTVKSPSTPIDLPF